MRLPDITQSRVSENQKTSAPGRDGVTCREQALAGTQYRPAFYYVIEQDSLQPRGGPPVTAQELLWLLHTSWSLILNSSRPSSVC